MNDHILNRITRETIHAIQKQIIIILHSKLEPVHEAAKVHATQMCLQVIKHRSQNCQLAIPFSRPLLSSP